MVPSVAHGICPVSALAPSRRVAAGAEKKDSPVGQVLGRSRGGFTTKFHLSCDAQGRICALALTDGQAGDCPQALGLLVHHAQAGQVVLADRAYDADYVRTQIEQAGAVAVIPGKTNRLVPIELGAKSRSTET